MLPLLVIAILTAVLGAVIYNLIKMDHTDRVTFVSRLIFAMKLPHFLHKTGLAKRPEQCHVLRPDGTEFPVPVLMDQHLMNDILEMEIREDDVFVVTFPKSGTSWMQEIVWLLLNDGDIKKADESPNSFRVPFLELIGAGYFKGFREVRYWNKDIQRVIRTHLPMELLPRKLISGKRGKIVYVARNPKDACVSYFHFCQINNTLPEPGTWSEFLTNFCAGKLGSGSWFSHVLPFWEMAKEEQDRIHFTTYEDMKKDLKVEILKLTRFFGKELPERKVDEVLKYCSFDSMSENKATNYEHATSFMLDFSKSQFLRKGQVGDWKNHFTLNENAAFDDLFKKQMEGTDLKISFEIEEE